MIPRFVGLLLSGRKTGRAIDLSGLKRTLPVTVLAQTTQRLVNVLGNNTVATLWGQPGPPEPVGAHREAWVSPPQKISLLAH